MPRPPLSRTVAVGALTLVAFAGASATPCEACSCAGRSTLAEAAADADAVFVGTYLGERGSPVTTSSVDLVAKQFEVREVFEGDVRRVTEVLTAAAGGSCGLEVDVGREYVVFASRADDGLRATLCGGTRELTGVTTDDLEALGRAGPAAAGESGTPVPADSHGVAEGMPGPVLWTFLAGASALVVAGVSVVRRRRRTAEAPLR